MILLISILYFVIIFCCIVGAVFILYHIVQYSYSRTVAMLTMGIFIPIFLLLLLVNFLLFSSLKLEDIFDFAGLINF